MRLVDLSSDWSNSALTPALKQFVFNNFDNEAKGVMGSCLVKVYLVYVCVYVCVSSVSSSDSMLFF